MRYICSICGHVYDETIGDAENDIEPGTLFADLPDAWSCPDCGVDKSMFEPEN
jgi:rubredoxin